MHMKHLILPASLALILAACGTPAPHAPRHDGGSLHNGHSHDGHDHQHNTSEQRRFSCQNGLSVSVRHLSNDRLELRLDDKRTVMSSAVSGSGSRYVSNSGLFGSGAEWHQKANEASFNFKDPYGNAVATVCRAG